MNASHTGTMAPVKSQTNANSLVWLFGISIAAWAFDFRALRGHSAAAFQGLILVFYITCFVTIAMAAAKRHKGIGTLWVFLSVTMVFMLESAAVGLINGQPKYSIVTNLIPLFLYASAAWLTYIVLSLSSHGTALFLDVLRWVCLASSLGHLAVTFLSRGSIDVSKSRYEVLSGAVIPSLAIMAVGLARKLSRLDIIVSLLNLSISLLSVTRTLLFVLVAQVGAVILARPSVIFRRSARNGAILFGAILLSVVALDLVAGTGLAARWTNRLMVSSKLGTDPSKLLRIAETHFMWDRFISSPKRILFGNGLAAVTSAIGREDVQAESLVGWEAAQIHMIGIGHENYVSILYVSGLLGGGGLLVLQLMNGVQSLLIIRTLQRWRLLYGQWDAHLGIWGALIVIGMLTVGFGSGTFGDRPTSLWFGVGTGMLYWIRDIVRASNGGPNVRVGQSV